VPTLLARPFFHASLIFLQDGFMRLFTHAIIALALLTSCKAASEMPKTAPTNAEIQAAKPGDALSPLEKDGTPKSSFPEGVVVRLNAIMTRSKATIDQFDKIRPGLEQASKSGTADLTELKKLYEEAKLAKADLNAEGQKLLNSRQYYDVVIFSGMANFAEKVEKELSDEIKLLSEKVK
jgi:hypothetical protein